MLELGVQHCLELNAWPALVAIINANFSMTSTIVWIIWNRFNRMRQTNMSSVCRFCWGRQWSGPQLFLLVAQEICLDFFQPLNRLH